MNGLDGKVEKNKIRKEQLEVLKIPIISGRWHPYNLTGVILMTSIFMLLFSSLAGYYGEISDFYRITDTFQYVNLRLAIFFAVCSFIYFIKPLAIRFQKIQFLIFMLNVQILGVQLMFLGATGIGVIAVWKERTFIVTLFILSAGILIVFVLSALKIIKKIKENEYSLESKRFKKRIANEFAFSKPALGSLSGLAIFSTGISAYLGESVMDTILVFSGIFFIVVTYLIIYLFPEHIITAYCKFKYEDFNIYPSSKKRKTSTSRNRGRKRNSYKK